MSLNEIKEIIPIVFATDENYVMPTAVAIKSLVLNYSGQDLLFVVLIRDELSEESKKMLKYAVESGCINTEIRYYTVDEKLFGDLKSHISHISMATYYRLLLPQILSNYRRCIYLDGDVLVNGDVTGLLDICMSDNYYVAGVKAFNIITSKLIGKKRLKILNIESLNNYINAGVIMFNLYALRKSGVADLWIKLAQNDYPVQDQDVINVACFGHIKIIPPKFNAMPAIFRYPTIRLKKVFTEQDIIEARTAPCIIHYAEKYKPWKYSNIENGELWYEYYKKIYGSKDLDLKKLGLTRFKDTQMMRLNYILKKVRFK